MTPNWLHSFNVLQRRLTLVAVVGRVVSIVPGQENYKVWSHPEEGAGYCFDKVIVLELPLDARWKCRKNSLEALLEAAPSTGEQSRATVYATS